MRVLGRKTTNRNGRCPARDLLHQQTVGNLGALRARQREELLDVARMERIVVTQGCGPSAVGQTQCIHQRRRARNHPGVIGIGWIRPPVRPGGIVQTGVTKTLNHGAHAGWVAVTDHNHLQVGIGLRQDRWKRSITQRIRASVGGNDDADQGLGTGIRQVVVGVCACCQESRTRRLVAVTHHAKAIQQSLQVARAVGHEVVADSLKQSSVVGGALRQIRQQPLQRTQLLLLCRDHRRQIGHGAHVFRCACFLPAKGDYRCHAAEYLWACKGRQLSPSPTLQDYNFPIWFWTMALRGVPAPCSK